MSNKNQETESEESGVENAEFHTDIEHDIKKFEVEGIYRQKQSIKNKTVVAITVHNQNEVNGKIKELIIKEDDFFKCTVCGKICKQRDNMRRHVELHIEGLSYECQFCNNTFR